MKDRLKTIDGLYAVAEVHLKEALYPRKSSDHAFVEIVPTNHPKPHMRVVSIEDLGGDFLVEMGDGYVFCVPRENVKKWVPVLKPAQSQKGKK